jgi:hypothetical protein
MGVCETGETGEQKCAWYIGECAIPVIASGIRFGLSSAIDAWEKQAIENATAETDDEPLTLEAGDAD